MMAFASQSSYIPWVHQDDAVKAIISKLDEAEDRGSDALVIMPTGGGKTGTMGLYLADQMPVIAFPRVIVLQGRRRILKQNRATISDITSHLCPKTSIVMAKHNDWSGDIIFATVQSLSKPGRLREMGVVTHILIDEAHNSGSASYKRIIRYARKLNPYVKVIKFTATPNRADGEPIATIEELAYQITYAELIDLGFLVPVVTRTIDLGLRKDFESIGIAGNEFDMATLGALLNKQIHHQSVIDHWIDQGGHLRQRTTAFCPTVDHALALAEVFRENGIRAACVHGEMNEDEVDRILEEYEAGQHQVLTSCAMLLEGWDSPITDCLINLRMMVAELTFLQAVGRGMRASEGKTDCLLLDFAGAALRHGTIEIRVLQEREARVRAETHAHPANDNDHFAIDTKPQEVIREFSMREIDIMRKSKPRFVEVPGPVPTMIAVMRGSWAAVACVEGLWHCITREKDQDLHVTSCTTANEAMTMADRYLLSLGDPIRDFEHQPVTYSQRRELTRFLIKDERAMKSRYDAECFLAMVKGAPHLKSALRHRGYLKAA